MSSIMTSTELMVVPWLAGGGGAWVAWVELAEVSLPWLATVVDELTSLPVTAEDVVVAVGVGMTDFSSPLAAISG
jgi:hypothetical protein